MAARREAGPVMPAPSIRALVPVAGLAAAAAVIAALAAAGPATTRAAGPAPTRAAGPAATSVAGPAPTRADLEAARVQVARLEAEHALARARKPWVVIDLPARTIRYRLLGMELRDVPFSDFETHGLERATPGGKAPEGRFLAGVFSLKEKEGDPRLSPLTPEQIEAGLDDENTADALPPDPPAGYRLWFDESLVVRVNGVGDDRGIGERLGDWWRSVRRRGPGGKDGHTVHLKIEIDAAIAREVYRSLLPGSRIVLVTPRGHLLPDAGQPASDRLRPDRARTRPAPLPAPATTPEAGVPFRLPPPEDVPNGTPSPGVPGVTPAPSESPAPAPGSGEEKPKSEADPDRTPAGGEDDEDDAPLPDDWVPAEGEEAPPEP